MRIALVVIYAKTESLGSSFSNRLVTNYTCFFSGDFYKGVSSFVVIIVFAAPLMAIQYYTEQRLTLEWRRWLTNRLLMAYFSDQTFFRECLARRDFYIEGCMLPLLQLLSSSAAFLCLIVAHSACCINVSWMCSCFKIFIWERAHVAPSIPAYQQAQITFMASGPIQGCLLMSCRATYTR